MLYIAGWSRSGSTVLDQVLGQIDGWFSCGELRLAWKNFDCSCGRPVFDCELWRPILEEAVAADPGIGLNDVWPLRQRALHGRARRLAALALAHRADAARSSLGRYARVLDALYAAIAARTGARVLVDSSKTSSEACLAATLTGAELYVVHLVRDPRGNAFSWLRPKPTPTPQDSLPTMSPLRSSSRWLQRNAAIEALVRPRMGARYLRIRYEDFAARPRATVRSLCALVGEPQARIDFEGECAVRIGPSHIPAGNPSRFHVGGLEIRSDQRWVSEMDRPSVALATIPALPLMRRYAYGPVRWARPA